MSIYKAKNILILSCLLIVTLFVAIGCGNEPEDISETEISVNTDIVQIRDIAKSSKYSGTIRGKNEVYIIPKIAARVTAIHVNPGETVKKGQTILTLDNTDVETLVMQARAGQRAAEVQFDTANSNYERIVKLHEAGAVSDQQLEAARSGLDSSIAGRDQARAMLVQAQNQLNNCIISAPIDGVVGSINLSLGETASPQSPAAIVGDTQYLEVEVLVSESEISYIKAGSEVDVLIKAVGEEPFKGIVDSVSTAADPVKRNFRVKVSLENKDVSIKSGMFAEVTIATISKEKAVCVPRSAVLAKGAKMLVYTVDNDKRAQEREVEIGIENSRYVEITNGVDVGEEVIIRGNTLVRDGTLVRIVTGGEE